MKIQENVVLAPYTTLGVGGKARYFVAAKTVDELKEAAVFARKEQLPLLILGGGSNVLISDDGFPGVVVHMRLNGVSFEDVDEQIVSVHAYAGEDWDELVATCVERGLYGIENLSGIPGTVGGAPVQNIGAYGVELKDILVSVEVFDERDGDVKVLSTEDCMFGYRDSIFKHEEGQHLTVLKITLRLKRNGKLNTTYRGVQEYFEKHGVVSPSLSEMRSAVIAIRAEKGMVIHPGHESYQSAGSFFKNPVVEKDVYEEVLKKHPETPMYEVDEQHVKIPAAFLVERVGFARGTVHTCKNVGISPKHTLALVNHGNARAQEFVTCAQEIQDKVLKEFNIQLEPEVRFIGF